MKKRPRIAVFAGPSGGHLFPALAFAEHCREHWPEARFFLFTSRRARQFLHTEFQTCFERIFFTPDFPQPRGFSFRTPVFLIRLLIAFILSHLWLLRLRPSLAVGFGSFASYPGMRLCVLARVPTLIHEQNIVPGRATMRLARRVTGVATSFPGTFRETGWKHVRCTGLPIRKRLVSAAGAGEFGEKRNAAVPGPGRMEILVSGGSQGASRLNQVILEALSGLSPEDKAKIAVNHITGKAEFDRVSQSYRDLGVPNRVEAFCERIEILYRKADMAITRSGANTLFELALFQLPAIVIPYPHAGAHQKSNALYFQSRSGIEICDESGLTAQEMREKILAWLRNPEKRLSCRAALRGLSRPDAAGDLMRWARSLIEKNSEIRQ